MSKWLPASPIARSALAICAILAVTGGLFWHSLGSVVAGAIIDIFIAFVRFFVALVLLFPNPF